MVTIFWKSRVESPRSMSLCQTECPAQKMKRADDTQNPTSFPMFHALDFFFFFNSNALWVIEASFYCQRDQREVETDSINRCCPVTNLKEADSEARCWGELWSAEHMGMVLI